jgi:sensor histidine kinase YesM
VIVIARLNKNKLAYVIAGALTIVIVAYFIWSLQPATAFYITGGWFILVAVLLWWGNRFISSKFDRILPWKRWGNFRFFILLFIGLLYLLIVINLTYILLKVMMTTDPPTPGQMLVTNVLGAGIFIPVFSIYFSLHFLKHWRKSELETEKIQKENMRTQLNLLKTQLDPHFLFNNLNILSALIDRDQQRSKQFVEKFADVYRALLKSKSDDLILLRDELEFIDAYIFLLKTRFENHVQFTINLKPAAKMRMIPPLTLQLLVENAIKHNTIDERHPLEINIVQPQDDFIVVSNSLNEKKIPEDRKGSGLDNIRDRYSYFTDTEIKVVKTQSHFEVHIPLLEIENG